MKLEEVIQYIKEADDLQREEFIHERIKFLKEHDVEKNKDGKSLSIKSFASEPVAYRFFLDENSNEIMAVNAINSMYGYYFDINEEIAEMLLKEIKNTDVKTIEDVCAVVSKVVFDYVGGRSVSGDIKDRLSRLKESDELDDNEKNSISAFKGSGNAWCSERSSIAHQLFKILGIESQIVVSPIEVDGKMEYHAFNMIRGDKTSIIFDSTMIDYSVPEEGYTSIVEVLPRDSFDTLNGISERRFQSRNGEKKSCVINPQNCKVRIVDVGYMDEKGL